MAAAGPGDLKLGFAIGLVLGIVIGLFIALVALPMLDVAIRPPKSRSGGQ